MTVVTCSTAAAGNAGAIPQPTDREREALGSARQTGVKPQGCVLLHSSAASYAAAN
jgi:hypothetical protein